MLTCTILTVNLSCLSKTLILKKDDKNIYLGSTLKGLSTICVHVHVLEKQNQITLYFSTYNFYLSATRW